MKTKTPRLMHHTSSKKKLFLPLFLAFIMIFSIFAIIFSGSGSTPPEETASSYDYKGHTFQQQSSGWVTTINGRQFALRYDPRSLESLYPAIDLQPLRALLSSEKVYLSVNPSEAVQLPLQELYLPLKQLRASLFLACLEDDGSDFCQDLPIKGCADAVAGVTVVILREGAAERVPSLQTQGDCHILQGTERDLLQLADKLILSLYGL